MIKAGDRVRRIGIPLYHGRGEEYDVGSEWTVQAVSVALGRINLREIPGTWDLDKFELVKEAKMCTCNEQSGVCSECAKKLEKAELTPGKKYHHRLWDKPYTYLAKTSTNRFVFENTRGDCFSMGGLASDYTEIKEKKKQWVNFYKDSVGAGFYSSKADADRVPAAASRIACIEVEYYEGQGL